MCSISFANEFWELHPERAIVWGRRKTLILADPHFGKASMFREQGLPVPAGTTSHDLGVLYKLVHATEIERLIVLGDFFHGRASKQDGTLAAMDAWRKAHRSLQIVLIRGNHDRHAGDPCPQWDIACHDGPLREGEVAFSHEPCRVPNASVICGHVHPSVRLEDFDGTRTRVPCFLVENQTMILPAFGRFTGTHPIRPMRDARIYIAAAGRIIPLPSKRRSNGAMRSEVVQQRAAKARGHDGDTPRSG